MKFLMLIKHAEHYRDEPIPQPLMDAVGEFVGDAMKKGIIKETAGLTPTKEGFRVRLGGPKLKFTDGPFTETKEMVGGFVLFEAASRDEAREFTRQFAELHRIHFPAFEGDCEVRPLEEI